MSLTGAMRYYLPMARKPKPTPAEPTEPTPDPKPREDVETEWL